MLSVEEFREKLGPTTLNDKQLERLKQSLYAFIGKFLDKFINKNDGQNQTLCY